MSTDINAAFADVNSKLTALGGSLTGVVTELGTLKTDVDTLITEVQAGGVNPADIVTRLQAIGTTLDTQKAALDAAATAATPPATIP